MSDIGDYITRQEIVLQLDLDQLSVLRQLSVKYPDLQRNVNRWNTERFTSALIVPTDCEIKHNCGCCEDSPVEVWPYMMDGDTRVYVTGVPFVVGEKNPYQGNTLEHHISYPGWDEKMREAKIPESIISKVRSYLGEDTDLEILAENE